MVSGAWSRTGPLQDNIADLLRQAGAGSDLAGTSSNPTDYFLRSVFVGDMATVQQMLQEGIDVNLISSEGPVQGLTALMLAAMRGHNEMVKLLLEHGADVHTRSADQETGQVWTKLTIDLLAAYHMGSDDEPLDYEEMDRFLGRSVPKKPVMTDVVWGEKDLNRWSILNQIWGNTALMFAAQGGHQDIIKLLVDKGANINEQNEQGVTPLIMAALLGYSAPVKFLIQQGADVKATSTEGLSPVVVASAFGHTDIVEYLLQQGATLDDEAGPVALRWAIVFGGHVDTVKFLLQHGVRPHMPSGTLIYSAANGYKEIVELLLDQYCGQFSKDYFPYFQGVSVGIMNYLHLRG